MCNVDPTQNLTDHTYSNKHYKCIMHIDDIRAFFFFSFFFFYLFFLQFSRPSYQTRNPKTLEQVETAKWHYIHLDHSYSGMILNLTLSFPPLFEALLHRSCTIALWFCTYSFNGDILGCGLRSQSYVEWCRPWFGARVRGRGYEVIVIICADVGRPLRLGSHCWARHFTFLKWIIVKININITVNAHREINDVDLLRYSSKKVSCLLHMGLFIVEVIRTRQFFHTYKVWVYYHDYYYTKHTQIYDVRHILVKCWRWAVKSTFKA